MESVVQRGGGAYQRASRLIRVSVSNTTDETGVCVCVRRGFVECWGGGSGRVRSGITKGSGDRWCFPAWTVHPNSPPQTMVYHGHKPKNEVITLKVFVCDGEGVV